MENFKDLQDRMSALLSGLNVDYAEIRTENTRDLNIAYSGTKLERVRRTAVIGGNVRALHKGGWGFVAFSNLDELEAGVKLAVEQAHAAGEVLQEKSQLADVPVVVEDVVPIWNMHPETISLDEKINQLGKYHKLMLSYPNTPSAWASLRETCSTITFANSEGSCIRQEKVDFSFYLMPEASKDGVSIDQFVSNGASDGMSKFFGLEEQIKEMCERTQILLDAPVVTEGVYTTICDPDLTGLFIHEAFGHLSEADDLVREPDFLKAMTLGRKLGRPILNIYEVGDIITGRGYLKYDDEGVLAVNAPLVTEGVLSGRMNSRWSSAKLNEPVTGSARAMDYRFEPIVRMRSTCIAGGESSFEDMIKDIKLGVYAVGGTGGQTNGEAFNFGASYGRMIRDGKLAEYVREVKLSGNVFTTMENIDMIGNEAQGIDGSGGCGKAEQSPLPTSNITPHVRIQNVVIGGEPDED